MNILIIDFETTGIDPKIDEPIEIGCVLYEPYKRKIIRSYSTLIASDKIITPEIEILTGISNDFHKEYGVPKKLVMKEICEFAASNFDYICAYNAPFDKGYWSEHFKLNESAYLFEGIKWIDAMVDVPYPSHMKSKKLTYLALEHGIFLQNAHRALSDCLAVAEILKKYDMEDIIFQMNRPYADVKVLIEKPFSPQGAITRESLKNFGFKWDGSKYWVIRVPTDTLDVVREFFVVNNINNISPIIEEVEK